MGAWQNRAVHWGLRVLVAVVLVVAVVVLWPSGDGSDVSTLDGAPATSAVSDDPEVSAPTSDYDATAERVDRHVEILVALGAVTAVAVVGYAWHTSPRRRARRLHHEH